MHKLVIALFCFFLPLIYGCGGEKKVSPDFIASIIKVEGEVKSRPNIESPYNNGEKDQKLINGSMIKTGKDGRASLKFVDNSNITVFPDSYFEVSTGKSLGKQLEGTAIYNVQKQESEIEVQTDHGVTAVLGTRFMIEVAPDHFALIVDDGRVRFTRKSDGEEVELGKGEKIQFSIGSSTAQKLEIQKVDPITRETLFGNNSKIYINY